MLKSPGKFDCTRSSPCHIRRIAEIILFAILLGALPIGASAQVPSRTDYPEIGVLAQSSYCNPYFGFRINFAPELKPELIHLPVQPHGRHMLLAMHLKRLDRIADILISAFEDGAADSAKISAKARVQQARGARLRTAGPHEMSLGNHKVYKLQIFNDLSVDPGDESSYYIAMRGYVLHIAVFTHEPSLASGIESAIEHLEFVATEPPACAAASPASMSSPNPSVPSVPDTARLYYGPALPTDLVESTLRQEHHVPEGRFSRGVYSNPELAIRVALPSGWKEMPKGEADSLTEIMRDPMIDPEPSDRRRALFRACSRVLFTATDPSLEMTDEMHPTLAVAAMPQGCVPDLVMPQSPWDQTGSEEFATLLARSLGVNLLGRGSVHGNPGDSLTFKLDGTLPYKKPGELLLRRISLRISARTSGQWLVLVYSVAPSLSAQRDLESRITIGTPHIAETPHASTSK